MDAVGLLREHKDQVRARFHVEAIGVFGSHARGRAAQDSDVDVLVAFAQGHKTFDHYVGLKLYLEGVFGCEVDLVIREAIKSRLKERILRETQYA